MKTLKIVIAFISLISLAACNPSQEELDTQKQIDDSLMEVERNKALNNADKLLLKQDSIDAANDTTAPSKK